MADATTLLDKFLNTPSVVPPVTPKQPGQGDLPAAGKALANPPGAPAAPATAQGGRPSTAPIQPAAAPQLVQPAAIPQPQPTMAQVPQAQPKPAAAPAAPAAPLPPQVIKLPRIPSGLELDTALPGSTFETPYGVVDASTKMVTLNDAGRAKVAEAHARAVKNFGPHPFQDIPGAPQPTIRTTGRNFNPFTGQFTRG